MLVGLRREWNGRETTRFEPVEGGDVDGDRLFVGDGWAIFEVVVLSLLLRLQIQTRKSTKILRRDRLVDGRTTSNSLTVVIGNVGPPVGLRFDVSEDHVLHRRGQSGHLPGNVRLVTTPRLREMLKDGARFVGTDSLRHHVEYVVHHGRTELQIIRTLHTLLGNGLCDSFRLSSFELSREQVAEPAFEKRDDAAEEEDPNTPARSPESMCEEGRT